MHSDFFYNSRPFSFDAIVKPDQTTLDFQKSQADSRNLSKTLGLFFVAALCFLSIVTDCLGAGWGNKPEDSPVYFGVKFAKHVRNFHTIADLQAAAKSKGDYQGNGGPGTTVHWRGFDGNKLGYMVAEISEEGFIGVNILTDDNIQITFNNRGAWDCEPESACAPLKNNIK